MCILSCVCPVHVLASLYPLILPARGFSRGSAGMLEKGICWFNPCNAWAFCRFEGALVAGRDVVPGW